MTSSTASPRVSVMSPVPPLAVAVIRPGPSGARVVAELFTVALFLALRAWVVMTVLKHFEVAQFDFVDALLLVVGVSALRGIKTDYLSWTHSPGRRR